MMSSLRLISSFTRKSRTFVRWSPCSWMILPCSSSSTIAPLHVKLFFHVFRISFRFKSEANPCTIVMLFRPFRCWIRICSALRTQFHLSHRLGYAPSRLSLLAVLLSRCRTYLCPSLPPSFSLPVLPIFISVMSFTSFVTSLRPKLLQSPCMVFPLLFPSYQARFADFSQSPKSTLLLTRHFLCENACKRTSFHCNRSGMHCKGEFCGI